jgi:hypothetical protein
MSTRLREDRNALNALITRAANALGINPAYVEKDFWATEVLRVASVERRIEGSTKPVRFIFKGGTSLSRVYGLIQRFSEDIDVLAVFPPGPGPSARRTVMKQVDADIKQHLAISSTVGTSETGVKRYTTYTYPTAFGATNLKEGVLLELGSRGGTHPVSLHEYLSLVALHARDVLGEGATIREEFAPFTVEVLAPERTLLEKLAAVHAAVMTNNLDAIRAAGRHFYDIGQLLGARQVTDELRALGPDGVAALVDDINVHSESAGFAWSPRPPSGFGDSPAFDPKHGSRDVIERGYATALELVHGPKPTLDEVLAVVHANRELL